MNSNNPLEWEKHQVDHLFLLIGENPLPNYVAARTLLQVGGKVYLVDTTGTNPTEPGKEGPSQRLREILGLSEQDRVPLEDNESDAYEIKKTITAKVKEIQEKDKQDYPGETKRFGLNYTGGTKAMAVHVYQALLELKLSPEPVFSYLDPRSLKMRIDHQNTQLDVLEDKVKIWLDISFEKLFDLHNLRWNPDDEPIKIPCLTEAAKDLVDLYINQRNSVAEGYRKWREDILAKEAKYQNRHWLYENQLKSVSLDLSNLPSPIQQVLKKGLNLSSNQLDLKVAKSYGFNKISQFCEWLNCGWIEHYVLWQVQQIRNIEINESAMSFHIEDSDNPNANWDKFEFDVAFRRGYQLFALSCTTAIYDDTCKEKLFEAYIRARQLGGAEARVALVCPHNDPARLEKHLKILMQDKKIAVFGQRHLKKLSENISKWIEGQSY
ncbi:Card1-like endonuclease domain-containing protein [Argonema antarcticum]|uniref:Card1-like endonuclease domain-containing protein n=1 Tax=Argonema antarcticum TaxID=2942763 RepID=UPI002011FEC4|nr:DUF1887 domain-containing protein [Argonema antarcticum]MCL1473242.1 DUF1887 domain-containing protein [Argonema antarcticum A004/B2]